MNTIVFKNGDLIIPNRENMEELTYRLTTYIEVLENRHQDFIERFENEITNHYRFTEEDKLLNYWYENSKNKEKCNRMVDLDLSHDEINELKIMEDDIYFIKTFIEAFF